MHHLNLMSMARAMPRGALLLVALPFAAAFAPSCTQAIGARGGLRSAAPLRALRTCPTPTRGSRASPAASDASRRGARGHGGAIGLASQADAAPMDAEVFAAKSEALAALSGIQDPFRGDSLIKLGAVKDLTVDPKSGTITANVIIGAPDLQGSIKAECEAALQGLSWVKAVELTMAALPPQDELREASRAMAQGLKGVKSVVACASCKGGVGKSTTSVNLAFSLAAKGYKVGIFDVDVYGPSLPTMVHPDRPFNPEQDIVGNAIMPPERGGVKMMSVGFINPQDSFVLRGAKVSPLVQQLVSTTEWGDLDYLIIDMPPGTGDIHLTLSQMEDFRIDAAVIVTTPQRLSFIDVVKVKGVEMFDKVGVPSVAVVENMAYLAPPGGGELETFASKYSLPPEGLEELRGLVGGGQRLFGDGHKARLREMWGIENSYSIPLLPEVARQGDSGTPFVAQFPESEAAGVFGELADAVVAEVASLKEGGGRPEVVFDKAAGDFVINGQQRLSAAELRKKCRSPANDPSRVPKGLVPTDMVPLGKYALSISWSDGHQSLMPYRAFVEGYEG